MPKVYDYICKTCGAKAELPYGREGTRHLKPSQKVERNMIVCGNFRRDWSSVNVNTTNLRAARG